MLYSLRDFNQVFEDGFAYQLPVNVRDIIENLTKQVGAPGYVCTPSFEKKHIEFKAPVVKTASALDNIRKNMNKISDNTFDSLKQKIIDDIQNTNTTEVSALLFGIASGNAFYSKLYARLYKAICDNFEDINPPMNADFVFASPIEYCSPNEDYDKYCEINKMNEKRRALALFCVNLFKEGATDDLIVFSLLDEILEQFSVSILTPEAKPVTDELSELIYIVMVNANERLCKDIRWNFYVQHVISVTRTKHAPDNGVTSKCVFKHMDLIDSLTSNVT